MKQFWTTALNFGHQFLSATQQTTTRPPLRLASWLGGSHVRLASCLGLATGCWLLQATIAPPLVQAYVARVNVELDYQNGETYEILVQRANVAARAAIQRSFDRDILVSEVLTIVTAQRNGMVVPIMSVSVTRAQWRRSPDSRTWANYFATTKTLLNLDQPISVPSAPTPPSQTNTPTTSSNPSPNGSSTPSNQPPTSGQPPAANIPLPGLNNGPIPTTIPAPSPSQNVAN